ncbi:DUF1998 domain-containing protein [Candidatus Thiodictyon syntrophicum]|jgi:hypothetical protein|uniref:MrfA-like Zn-binding domain-containing protein n=1 Tax=Candidatus Thiodictyon syntrophicum TaxID=1166950 RepID=A0A2K8UJJ1_9GAMM|nr:DUF1998 domain-containing protein [Candidatus Thiodictyon syntrophicum]AUB85697.1 hypothetical protein THSYN_32945 [Candidatus Thiodictyon syntrophicum]
MTKPTLRASQVITTFGPGAMVDLPDASVLIAGLDHWQYDPSQLAVIDEPRLLTKLADQLGRSGLTLRAPPPASDRPQGFRPDIVAWRFPEWFIVQDAELTAAGHRRRRLVHANALDGGRFRGDDRKNKSVVPIRFVHACIMGHIGDIDWPAFVHGTAGCHRELWIEERGTSGDLDAVFIICACGESRSVSQAARRDLKALGHCNGDRPWLGAGNREPCGELNRLLTRTASHAYFAQLMSVISIPDTRSPVDEVARSLWDDFLSDVETLAELQKVRMRPTPAARLAGIDDAAVMASIDRIRNGASGSPRSVKEVEFEALTEAKDELGSDKPGGHFYARTLPAAHWQGPATQSIERVVLVHRLREVVAQVGFTRFEAAGPDIDGELDLGVKSAALAADASWLPAVENHGEGIFLQFKAELIDTWLKRQAVIDRGTVLQAGFALWKRDHEQSNREFPGLPYILLHSLSHLLLTAVSLECGYPASSLRERVYARPGRYGILIYTGSPDAEGILGGLVQAGRDTPRHLRRAIELAALCSNDPVCAYHHPALHDHQPLNGAACHGCLLIAETSCEQRNEFLDRALVTATVGALGAEFFGS